MTKLVQVLTIVSFSCLAMPLATANQSRKLTECYIHDNPYEPGYVTTPVYVTDQCCTDTIALYSKNGNEIYNIYEDLLEEVVNDFLYSPEDICNNAYTKCTLDMADFSNDDEMKSACARHGGAYVRADIDTKCSGGISVSFIDKPDCLAKSCTEEDLMEVMSARDRSVSDCSISRVCVTSVDGVSLEDCIDFDDDSSKAGMIVAIVIGVVVLIFVVTAVTFYFFTKKKQNLQQPETPIKHTPGISSQLETKETAVSPPSPMKFNIGDRVVLWNLVSLQQCNGCSAIVQKDFDPSTGRYCVSLIHSINGVPPSLLVKPANLIADTGTGYGIDVE